MDNDWASGERWSHGWSNRPKRNWQTGQFFPNQPLVGRVLGISLGAQELFSTLAALTPFSNHNQILGWMVKQRSMCDEGWSIVEIWLSQEKENPSVDSWGLYIGVLYSYLFVVGIHNHFGLVFQVLSVLAPWKMFSINLPTSEWNKKLLHICIHRYEIY